MEICCLFDQGFVVYVSVCLCYFDVFYCYFVGFCGQCWCVWDCVIGIGQVVFGLVQYFGEVFVSDISMQQIEYVVVYLGICYSVQDVEVIDYFDVVFDLVCVVQVWYWFDYLCFNCELLCVLCFGGVFVVWGYGWFSIDVQIDVVIDEEYLCLIGLYWV